MYIYIYIYTLISLHLYFIARDLKLDIELLL